MESVSSSRRMDGASGTRSPLARVSVRLSSMTVFMDSTHSGSRSPSRTIHWWGRVPSASFAAMARKARDSRPSRHSRVVGCSDPYRSFRVTDCGACVSVVSETQHVLQP
jgi:hypothetical protein